MIEVLVKAGDRVAEGTPLVILESDKATLDVHSPQAGIILEIRVAVGDRVSVGSPLISLDAGTAPEAAALLLVRADAVLPVQVMPPQPLANEIPQHSDMSTPVLRFRAFQIACRTHGPRFAVALRHLGVDLGLVQDSGRCGHIMKPDLEKFIMSDMAVASNAGGRGPDSAGVDVAPRPRVDLAQIGTIERAPLTKMRKVAGSNLARKYSVIPHVTSFEAADITGRRPHRSGRRTPPMEAAASHAGGV